MPQNRVKMPQISTKRVGAVDLPYPPSTNRLWAVYRGYARKTAEAREYASTCGTLLLQAGIQPLTGPVSVTLIVERPRRAGDLDNRLKAVLDALNGYAYADDEQIVALSAYRVDGRQPGKVTVILDEVVDRPPLSPLDERVRLTLHRAGWMRYRANREYRR
jgi:crossover junction endodeoxyribonuclease RusA